MLRYACRSTQRYLYRPRDYACLTHVAPASSSADAEQQDGLSVFVLPCLSPSMTAGRIIKWHKAPGDDVREYDVVFEVATTSLTEAAYKVDQFAGEVTLLIEAQEEGVMGPMLHPIADTELPVNTPLALLCQSLQQAQHWMQLAQHGKLPSAWRDAHGQVSRLLTGPSGTPLRHVTWQSYLKDSGGHTPSCTPSKAS